MNIDGDDFGISGHGVVGGIVGIAVDADAEGVAHGEGVDVGGGDLGHGDDATGSVCGRGDEGGGVEGVCVEVGRAAFKLDSPADIAGGGGGGHPSEADFEAAG